MQKVPWALLCHIRVINDIITNDPTAELIGIHDQLLQQVTIMQICFLGVLSVINVLSLVLQRNHKDFGALRESVKYTINQIEQIQENVRGPLMKSFQKAEEITQNVERYCRQNVYWALHKEKVRLHIFECFRYFSGKNPALSGLETLRKRSLFLPHHFHKI